MTIDWPKALNAKWAQARSQAMAGTGPSPWVFCTPEVIFAEVSPDVIQAVGEEAYLSAKAAIQSLEVKKAYCCAVGRKVHTRHKVRICGQTRSLIGQTIGEIVLEILPAVRVPSFDAAHLQGAMKDLGLDDWAASKNIGQAEQGFCADQLRYTIAAELSAELGAEIQAKLDQVKLGEASLEKAREGILKNEAGYEAAKRKAALWRLSREMKKYPLFTKEDVVEAWELSQIEAVHGQ